MADELLEVIIVVDKYSVPGKLIIRAIKSENQIKFKDPVTEAFRSLECRGGLAFVDGDYSRPLTYDSFIYFWFYGSRMENYPTCDSYFDCREQGRHTKY